MDAREQQAQITVVLRRSIRRALSRADEDEDWYLPSVRRARLLAHRLFIDLFDEGVMPPRYKRQLVEELSEMLAKTEESDDLRQQADVIAHIMARSVVDSVVTAGAPEGTKKTWNSVQDDKVRETHREAHGQEVPASEKFSVGGADMIGPGDPTAPAREILNCRCFLSWELPEARTASTLLAGGKNMDELLDVYEEVPWYGVLAPEGVRTGDGREFDPDSLTHRDLPLPLRWQEVDAEGHDGSVVVGSIRTFERRDGLIHATGVFTSTDEAAKVIGLIADGSVRGISVDLDDTEVEYRSRDGVPLSEMEKDLDTEDEDAVIAMMEAYNSGIMAVTKGRVCSAAICAIPAFAEAFIALGFPPEADAEESESIVAAVMFAKIDEKPWSDYPESAYDVQQWHRASLIHLHDGEPTSKSDCKLPIRTPSGALSRAGVHAAASRVDQTDAPEQDIAAAKRALVRAYDELDEEPPEGLTASADFSHEFSGTSFFKDLAPGKTEDGPGWLTHPVDTDRLRDYWAYGEGAALIGWGLPGDFNRCRGHLAKYIKPQYLSGYCANRHYDALGFWPGNHAGKNSLLASSGIAKAPAWSLVAAAEPSFRPPREWFDDPQLPEITPITITEEGRVYGHLAEWGTCHTGFDLECVEPPTSPSGYAHFHLGGQLCDDGAVVPVGSITVDTGHAALNWSRARSLAHYDDTGTVVAHVRVGEDAHGIWFAGCIASYATAEMIDKLRACKISGDWREFHNGELDMIAALGVNAPGFEIARPALAASAGRRTALVAAGLIHKDVQPSTVDIGEIVARTLRDYREFDRIKASVIRARRETLSSMRRTSKEN